MSEMNPENFVLTLTVGGSVEPLIESIKHHKPKYVIFIASRDSRNCIDDILQKTGGKFRHETIVLSDFQNLLACVRDIREELRQKLDLLDLAPDTLVIADITGGTKVMSAALTLVMMEFNSRFTYVGGNVRSKVGLGTVETGHEIVFQMDNPWDAMGFMQAKSLVQSFNAGQFAEAREKADFIKSRDIEYSSFYDGLGMVIEAFRNWDIFNYRPAKKHFEQGLGRLRVYNTRKHKNFQALYTELLKAYETLEKTEKEAVILQGEFQQLAEGCGETYLRDLAANARRCAKRGHFDDAVARLYSVVEKVAKISLAQHGVNNSCLSREILGQAGVELMAKYANVGEDDVKLPLTDSFKLFCVLKQEHPLAETFRKFERDLANTLQSRNMSLLAHGYIPVKEDDYQKLFAVTLEFLNISEQNLPNFPVLETNAIIF